MVAVVVGGTVGTVVASVAAAAAVASVLLAVPGAPTVVGGDVGGAKGKCKIAASLLDTAPFRNYKCLFSVTSKLSQHWESSFKASALLRNFCH